MSQSTPFGCREIEGKEKENKLKFEVSNFHLFSSILNIIRHIQGKKKKILVTQFLSYRCNILKDCVARPNLYSSTLIFFFSNFLWASLVLSTEFCECL